MTGSNLRHRPWSHGWSARAPLALCSFGGAYGRVERGPLVIQAGPSSAS